MSLQTRIQSWVIHCMLATIRLVLSITWVCSTPDPGYLDHVLIRLESILYRNQSTAKKASNSLWTVLRMRVGRVWLRISLNGITLLRVHWNRGQFQRKTCHIRMCHIHILYRILPQILVTRVSRTRISSQSATYGCLSFYLPASLPLLPSCTHILRQAGRLLFYTRHSIAHTKFKMRRDTRNQNLG